VKTSTILNPFLISLVLSGSAASVRATEAWNCRILRDATGIPAIEAPDRESLLACWGRIHGSTRPFQMDYLRRIFQGRRAEVTGFGDLRSDLMMRLLDLDRRARDLTFRLPPTLLRELEAYSEGVNEGFAEALARRDAPLLREGMRPDPWLPEHTIGLLLLESFDQTRKTFAHDLQEETWKKTLKADAAALTTPDGLPWDDAVLDPGEYPRGARTAGGDSTVPATPSAVEPDSLAAWASGLFPALGAGSNNWVISPSHSATGHAWLANDPHLDLKRPAFWHWVRLKVPGELEVFGAAVPGMPVVVSGANRHAAWGLTNSYLDVADVLSVPREELKDRIETTRPLVWFRFMGIRWPFFFKSFERVRDPKTPESLPILPIEGAGPGRALVLRWTGFDLEPNDIQGLWDLLTAHTAQELDVTLSRTRVPSWNFVFADTAGSIGYRAVGRIPRREHPPEYGVPQVTASALGEPVALLDAADMPHALNPKRGWIATANQRQWPPDARFHGGRGYSPGFRGHRIRELLTARPKHDAASLAAAQCDTRSVDAEFFVPLLLASARTMDSNPKGATDALELLRTWDYSTTAECRACGIYRRWMDWLGALSELPDEAVYRLLKADPRRLPVGKALARALRDLEKTGEQFPEWKKIHRAPFEFLAGETWFAVPPIFAPGDRNSVNPGTSVWTGLKYDVTSGASQRILVELSDPPHIQGMLAGANEGPPEDKIEFKGSPWVQWAECRHAEIPFPLSTGAPGWKVLRVGRRPRN
jgi:penicillin amidase